MDRYNHKNIEGKWQNTWKESGSFKTSDDPKKPKYYVLDMFPYPSGEGLHVGHPKGYIATDVISRFKTMNGFNVLHPMGWDAFGLPAENYAIKNKVHPRVAVEKNIKRFKEQLDIIGFTYDWDKEINTTDPEYYKWTQWIFLKLHEKGLAYESNEPINWCPSCKTGLANEDLVDGKCERCGSIVEQKPIRQWVLKIREYADRLLDDIEELDWPKSIKESQRNWIGRSEGSNITFDIKDATEKIEVFTTRADTLFGATYMVIAPEHPLIHSLEGKIENIKEVKGYIEETSKKNEIERTSEGKEKTGVLLEGISAINPINKESIPVYIADYVLAHYGTGAIMAVPGHDERDKEFAIKYNLPIKEVVDENKKIINSFEFDGLTSEEAKKKITEKAGGELKTDYKLRDWVFSRQRYWGEPIPIVHCGACGAVPVKEEDLPVILPEVESYEPTGTGESPLAGITDWVNTKCPKCDGAGKRETNTMPQWAGSSWYYLRYIDPNNTDSLVDIDKEKFWSPVDLYVGGAEHATRHLIYARFWHKFLYDIKVVNYSEPFKKLQHVGLIGAEDGRKMSKRWGNVVNPDDVISQIGADSFRVYEMFMGPFDQPVIWSTDGVVGPRRFLEKVWKLQESVKEENDSDENIILLNRTIKKVTEDIESVNFNTAISQLMIAVNAFEKESHVSKDSYGTILKLLAPFAPHITEEIWSNLGEKNSIHKESFPSFDESKIEDSIVSIVVQVNGKVRDSISVERNTPETEILEMIHDNTSIQKWVEGKEIKKTIFVENKLINLVV
ncbi:MAG: leucyl-tRNA synthetase [Candidatus Paceibacteria bacterium]|jgi:leucyl-tRNA synthetase